MSGIDDVIAHPSSTVLPLRDGPTGLEVLMLTRPTAASFAGGALVFPGGRVDAEDRLPAVGERCRAVSGLDAAALSFRIAGVRETFEEVRLLLARLKGEAALVSGDALAALEARLTTSLGRAPYFADLVASGEIELATDLLVPFAHWITPAGRPRRYDTHFFLAPAPADQVAAHDGQEAVDSRWIAPADAIAEAAARRITLVFATRMTLLKLGESRDVAAALAAARTARIVTVCPEIVETPDGLRIRIAAESGYGAVEMPAFGEIKRTGGAITT